MAIDPLTALPLAGTIVQIVEFGSKLAPRSQELYSSGSLSVNQELNLVTEILLKLLTKLRQPQLGLDLGVSSRDTFSYQVLIDLCDGCT